MKRFSTKEKRKILAEIEAAPHGEKQAVHDEYGVSSQTVSKWRKALNDGSLGQPRGRRKHAGWEAAVERLDKAPKVLGVMRDADPDLAASDLVPARNELHKRILDGIADEVVRGELPWSGEVDDYDDESRTDEEDVKANARIRLSRKRAARKKELALLDLSPDEVALPRQGETDWLGDRRIVTWSDLCRRGDCPCNRLCKVKHLHAEEEERDENMPPGVPARPPRIVCVSRTCEINRYALSWKFGGVLHMHWPKHAETDLSGAGPADPWTSPADCPWHGTCDLAHARIEDSAMITFDKDLHYAYPVEFWCWDPECGEHRVGCPHVHCSVCGEEVFFMAGKHELDLSGMKRVDAVGPGPLCEKHYFELRDKLLKRRRR